MLSLGPTCRSYRAWWSFKVSLVTAPCVCCTQEGGGQSRLCVPTSSSPGSGLKEGPEPTKKGPVGGSQAHPGLGPPGSLHTQGRGTIPHPTFLAVHTRPSVSSWRDAVGTPGFPSGAPERGPTGVPGTRCPLCGFSHSYTTSADPHTDPGPCVQMGQYQMGPQNHHFSLFLS